MPFFKETEIWRTEDHLIQALLFLNPAVERSPVIVTMMVEFEKNARMLGSHVNNDKPPQGGLIRHTMLSNRYLSHKQALNVLR
ncbi:hypothetical protein OA44_18215 [Enterobacter cloacae]|nr:hypothetical protein OA44_18215 [Enterobacter cloacae]